MCTGYANIVTVMQAVLDSEGATGGMRRTKEAAQDGEEMKSE
jgi:hypothetical protein